MRFLPFYLLLLAFPASADDSGRIETALKEKGFRCTELPRDEGAICIDPAHVTVVVPKGVKHARTIYFAHGDLNVCAGGLSGESHFRDQAPFLRGIGAIAVLPKRNPSRSQPDFGATVSRIDGITRSTPPWGIIGHSWAGKMIPAMLNASPAARARVDKVLLLDAAFDVEELMVPRWTDTLKGHRALRIKAVSNEAWAKTERLRDQINAKFPGAVTAKQIPGIHCQAARYAQEF